jgi:hypothetical protein
LWLLRREFERRLNFGVSAPASAPAAIATETVVS